MVDQVRRQLQMVNAKRGRRRRKMFFCLSKTGQKHIIQNIYLYENATDSIFKCDSTKSPSNLLNLIPSCAFSLSLSFFWPQFLLPISISTCQSVAHLFSVVASPALLQQSVTDFHLLLFFQHLHINSRPSRLTS